MHKVMIEREFKSVIIVTSPTHSRRAWLTFKKVFEDDEIMITSLPSRYQAFDPKNWWTKRKYSKEVVFEYQKLIYYKLAYGI
ncbi:MAG: YdcF family protein [Deltaproteobacteria bacterium]|nr:YdcF family protein [Deltaproteobacteria bacterium]